MNMLLPGLLLGILQGLTEFLPVSSSGHLALVLHFTGWEESRVLPLVVGLHVATTMSVLVYLRRPVLSLFHGFGKGPRSASQRRLILLLVAASVPTALMGLWLKDVIESLFASSAAVAAGLAVTGALLLVSDRASGSVPLEQLSLWKSLMIGTAQGVAIAPGISRSGATIGAGVLLGMDRAGSFAFSFLLSVPAVLGAAALEWRQLGALGSSDILSLGIGMATAFLTGVAALRFLEKQVRKARLAGFAVYCWLVAATVLAVT